MLGVIEVAITEIVWAGAPESTGIIPLISVTFGYQEPATVDANVHVIYDVLTEVGVHWTFE